MIDSGLVIRTDSARSVIAYTGIAESSVRAGTDGSSGEDGNPLFVATMSTAAPTWLFGNAKA